MSQGLEKQLENVLLDLTKEDQNSDSIDPNRLLQEIHTNQGVLEMQKNDFQQKIIRLKKSRDYYQRLYDSAPAALFILNNQGVILDVNFAATELIGVGKSLLINSDLARHVAPEFMDAFFYHRRWTLETDVKQTCELKLVKGDCSSFFARLESISLAADDRNQAHIQTIISDISDQKQMEGALEVAKTRAAEAGKIKGEFLSKMSHEFRTPLNHIIGFTELAIFWICPSWRPAL
jgi:PAS domain S-box-containing protein